MLGPRKRRSLLVFFAGLFFVAATFMVFPAVALADRTYNADELAFVDYINIYRANNGLDPLLVSDVVSDAAWKHCHDMAKYDFNDHITRGSDWFPLGSNAGERMVLCGYPANHGWGENIATGFDTALAVFNAWAQSAPHNATMLDERLKVIGVAFYTQRDSEAGTYWTTYFGDFVDGSAHVNRQPIPPDTTKPTVAIMWPNNGADVSGSVTVTVNASDNVGVAKVDLYVNGYFVASDDAAPYAFAWDTTVLNPGTYILEARAYDKAGNTGSMSITVHTSGGNGSSTTTTTTTGGSTTTTTTPGSGTTTTTSTSTTTTSTTLPGVSFPDVKSDSPFYQPILALAAKGIISGFDDGLFRPAVLVTRAQFTKIVVLALDKHTAAMDNADHPTFKDVPNTGGAYPFDFVEEAAGLKIITGYAGGIFKPGENVTRLQLALMLVRAGGTGLDEPPAGYVCPFADVPEYGREAVAKALYNKILSGKTTVRFDPYSPASRGQVAKMVYGLIEAMK